MRHHVREQTHDRMVRVALVELRTRDIGMTAAPVSKALRLCPCQAIRVLKAEPVKAPIVSGQVTDHQLGGSGRSSCRSLFTASRSNTPERPTHQVPQHFERPRHNMHAQAGRIEPLPGRLGFRLRSINRHDLIEHRLNGGR